MNKNRKNCKYKQLMLLNLLEKFSKSKGKALWRPAGAKQLRITCQIIQNGGLRAQPRN
jgi:hypothetical protein